MIARSAPSLGARLAGASAATFLVYAARALYAGALAWPIADYATTNTHVLHPYATLLSGALVSSGSEAAFYVALTLLVAPALSIIWLRALAAPAPLRELSQLGLARYGVALRISLMCLLLALLALAVSGAAAVALHRALAFTHDARLRDLAALSLAVPCAACLAWLATLHDAAHAAAALDVIHVRSALRLARASLDARLVLARVAVAGGALLLTLVGALLPRSLFGFSSPLAGPGVLLVSQAFALALTLVRGLWLAAVVARVTARCESTPA